jgi:hypothetical protein
LWEFFEGDEDAGLAGHGPGAEELQAEHRLARAGSATGEGGAAAGEPAFEDLIEAGDLGGDLGNGTAFDVHHEPFILWLRMAVCRCGATHQKKPT